MTKQTAHTHVYETIDARTKKNYNRGPALKKKLLGLKHGLRSEVQNHRISVPNDERLQEQGSSAKH